jgi:hypothetical protein
MSACDAVDGALPGDRRTLRSVGADQAAKGADHGGDCDPRVGYREVCVSGPWRQCGRSGGCASSDASIARAEVLRRAGSLHRGDRSLRDLSPLVAPAAGAGTQREVDAAVVRRPYVKRQKNDMADAEAICEAVMRPTMRFVETKTPEQQGVLMLHRIGSEVLFSRRCHSQQFSASSSGSYRTQWFSGCP